MTENIGAKILKKVGAILSQVIKTRKKVAANNAHLKKIQKKQTAILKEIAELGTKINGKK